MPPSKHGDLESRYCAPCSPIRYTEPLKNPLSDLERAMTATLLYRISAFVLVLFAAGHTGGFLTFKAPTVEGVPVQQPMDKGRFSINGKTLTYGDFYLGFGLYCTAYLLFTAFLAWHLGSMAKSTPQAIGALGWVFFLLQIVGIALSWRYFILPPTIFSVVLAILTGWAAGLVGAAKA